MGFKAGGSHTGDGFEEIVDSDGGVCRLCGARIDAVVVYLKALWCFDDVLVSSQSNCVDLARTLEKGEGAYNSSPLLTI